MALGALVLFFPYTFANGDLPRYQYAKRRWVDIEGLPESWWAAKMQQETLSQCFANSVILATPIMLAAFNPSDSIHPVEVLGYLWWGAAWLFENAADVQMVFQPSPSPPPLCLVHHYSHHRNYYHCLLLATIPITAATTISFCLPL
jgi:steroid 5-alpha reductase family enzyme